MLPIDPGDGQGSSLPGGQTPRIGGSRPPSPPAPVPPDCAPDGKNRHHIGRAAGLPQPLRDFLPAQAMAHGGTIIRPGAVAWGGPRDAKDSGYSSCEVIERTLASVTANPGRLPGLLAELTTTRLWVPLPVRHRPFTDGTAVRLPLVTYAGTDFVPCFTSVQRLAAWADAAPADPGERRFTETGRRWQRAGDARVVPHIVVPAVGLARRLPAGLGLAINPDSAPGMPLYPESVSYLARLTGDGRGAGPCRVGHPPTEPEALLRGIRAGLRTLPPVGQASRAWLSVPGQGEGLVIAVTLDDPASDPARMGTVQALDRAIAAVPLRVPFPVDVIFPGEMLPSGPQPGEPVGGETYTGGFTPDMIEDWMARNTRPFYTRGINT